MKENVQEKVALEIWNVNFRAMHAKSNTDGDWWILWLRQFYFPIHLLLSVLLLSIFKGKRERAFPDTIFH